MNDITEYKVIAHNDQPSHSELVTAALQEGWQLQGGVSITAYINSVQEETVFFAQALIKSGGAGKDA